MTNPPQTNTSKRTLYAIHSVKTMASFSTLATLSTEAIEEFTVLYGEYLDEHNVTGAPAPNEIKYWMLFKLTRGDFADEDSKITKKTKVSNKNASKEAEEQPEQPEQSVEESVPPSPSSNMREAHTLKSARIEVSVQGSDKVHKLDLPFLPNCVDYSKTCQALKLNGNLLTPCLTKKKAGGDLCASCSKANAPLGRISDRIKFPIGHYVVEAETGKTKKIQKKEEMTFGTYIAKRGLTREQVEDKINHVFSGEIVIPEEHWVVDEKKAQKTVSAKSSETGSSDGDSVASSKKSRKPRKKKSEKAAEVASDEEDSQPEELPEPKDEEEEEEEQVNNKETPFEDDKEEEEDEINDSDDDASVVDASDSETEDVQEKQQEKEEEKVEEQVKQKTKPALKKTKPAVKKSKPVVKKTESQSSQLEEEDPHEY